MALYEGDNWYTLYGYKICAKRLDCSRKTRCQESERIERIAVNILEGTVCHQMDYMLDVHP